LVNLLDLQELHQEVSEILDLLAMDILQTASKEEEALEVQ